MSHPRYLTAMAVGMEVCRDFPEDKVAADGITPPWLVFEWLMVEGLVRTAQGNATPACSNDSGQSGMLAVGRGAFVFTACPLS